MDAPARIGGILASPPTMVACFAALLCCCLLLACDAGGDAGSTPSISLAPRVFLFEGAGTGGLGIANGAAAANARDFGALDAGTGPTAALVITVENGGTASLALGLPVLSGDVSDFQLDTTSFSTVVAAGLTTEFSIAFDPASTGTKTITVSLTHDATAQTSTPFRFDATGLGTSGGLPSITPDISISNPAPQLEGNAGTANMSFTVSLSAPTALTVTVNYATGDITATAVQDYLAQSGLLTFISGQTTMTVDVPIVGDTVVEPDEQFTVTLSTPVNCVITTATGTGTILNDDGIPAPTYAADIQPIFNLSCTGCHPINGGLNLTSYANLMAGGVSGAAVVPSNSAASLLVQRLEGTITPQMPFGQPPLPSADIQRIKDWIDAGALDN